MDNDDIDARVINVTINGTGFAADYTARAYSMLPHKNGVWFELAGVTSGKLENAQAFVEKHDAAKAYESHAEMVAKISPDIDHITSANFTHGPFVQESSDAGVSVIVLEKPPVIWPGYRENRQADAATRKQESMAYLEEVLNAVRRGGARLLYAENFVYLDGVRGLLNVLKEAVVQGKGRVLYQHGICAHQGSHAPAYDTPSLSGGGALFNKACHPLGPCLYVKQIEGLLRDGKPIRPVEVSACALQILKNFPPDSGTHFRVIQNVDDFARVTVRFEDGSVAEVLGHDLSISGIRNEYAAVTDFGEYQVRSNPNNASELFLPDGTVAGSLLFREKLPTSQGTSFPSPDQLRAHGYINEMEDAVECALDPERKPQSGLLTAWDTMAVLMAGYESAEAGSQTVNLREYTIDGPDWGDAALPDPADIPDVFQRV
jgi:predicted dehydrogenase